MKEKDKLDLLTLLKKHVWYCDGFFLLQEKDEPIKIVSEEEVREFIRLQMQPILEKDVTDCISELCYNKRKLNIDAFFKGKFADLAEEATGESIYFKSLDKIYPNNKFREIMNYYLFSDDLYCFIIVGYGQTGKSTFVDIISKIMGEAFFGRSNVSLLKDGHGTAVLEGKNFYEVAEAQDLDLDTANQLKSIITNNDIYVNPKFEIPRTFKPHIKLIMTCNNVPRFKVTDDGIIRRFITIKMNEKLPQNRHFLAQIEADLPNIVAEALAHPFKIEDFAEEQYTFFLNDAQYGFGFGVRYTNKYIGEDEYEKYKNMCKACGYMARNKANFDKFIELAGIYKKRCLKCDITLKDATPMSGVNVLMPYDGDDLPF